MDTILACLLGLVAAGTWALASHLIRGLLGAVDPERRPSAAGLNALRSALGLVAFVALWAVLGGPAPVGGAWLGLVLSGAIGFALGDTLYFAALPRCGVQTAAMLGLLNVPLAAVAGWLFLDQALSAGMLAAMGVVILGVGLVLSEAPDGGRDTRAGGVLLALGAAACWAAATIGGHAAIQGVGVLAGASVRLAGALVGSVACGAAVGLGAGATVRGELATLVRPLRSRALLRLVLPAVACSSLLNLIPYHFALRELPGAIGALLFATTPLFTLPLARWFPERVGPRARLGTWVGFAGVAGVILLARAPEEVAARLEVREVAAPEAPGARWPDLARDGERLALSYLVPGEPHRLMVVEREGEGWSAPRGMASGAGWFVNWADFPRVALVDGAPAVTWLEELGEAAYAYGVRLRVGEGSRRWLHGDRSASEHGFVSLVPLGDGELFAVWLDGRRMPAGGPMTLRARVVGEEELLLDGRVCECCCTDAALLPDGRVLVVWRDRTEEERRDVAWTVADPRSGDLAPPRDVHRDGWTIPGCPVNGPAVAARDGRVAVAWFTAADDRSRVQVAFADRDVTAFGAPVRVDDGRGLGRVDAVFLGGDLLVTWLEETALGAEWRARLVSEDGERGESVAIAEVEGSRADGFLRMAATGTGALATFVDVEADGVRVVELRR